jgi:hypothetical protein
VLLGSFSSDGPRKPVVKPEAPQPEMHIGAEGAADASGQPTGSVTDRPMLP